MPQKVRKTSQKKPKVAFKSMTKDEQMENEKENQVPELASRRRRNVKKLTEILFEETESELDDSGTTISKSNEKIRTLGFWSRKLKDLEENAKNKKCGLYEFSGTDESESSYKRKKKRKPKVKVKKKQPIIAKHFQLIDKSNKVPRLGTKAKKTHSQSLCRERILLNKERKKLADQGAKFTFSTGISSLGITSTPSLSKDNLVGASNFLFLSPINKEDVECKIEAADNNQDQPVKDLHQETPKMDTKLKRISCRRVLRSGKMLQI